MKYVVIACHFKNSSELCSTTIARLRTAIAAARESDTIVVTGDVPYERKGPTLGELMRDWLVRNNFPSSRISLLRGAVGTFSEAREACVSLGDRQRITIISSWWYFFQAKPIWRRRAWEHKITLQFVSVPRTGGWCTAFTYIALGIIVRTAILTGFESVIEDRLTVSQYSRRKGFTFNGCR